MTLYRILSTLVLPILLAGLAIRILRRRETWVDVRQRMGFGEGHRGAIWVHGASNGELISAKSMIKAVSEAFPDRQIVVTCNTITARALVENWGFSQVYARLAPLDDRFSLARFTRIWQPVALIIVENELWPNRLVRFSGPIFCVGGRLSKRSARRWGKAPKLARAVLGQIDVLAAQDQGSADRFLSLGVRRDALMPLIDLKADVALPMPSKNELTAFANAYNRQFTVLAASTHPGEDETVFDAFIKAHGTCADLRLILAPRHPKRAPDIVALGRQKGLPISSRTKGEPSTGLVYVADTMGEMALWYSLAGITFVGGSLVDVGGHTPYEPAKFRSAILHGPYVDNFRHTYDRLSEGQGAVCVADAKDLAKAIIHASDQVVQSQMSGNATNVLWRDATGSVDLTLLIERLKLAVSIR